MNEEKNDLEVIVKQIKEGISNEETVGMVLRTVQTALSCQLISTMDRLKSQMDRISTIQDRIITRFEQTVEPLLETDAIPHTQLFEYLTTIQKNQAATVDLYRKIVQSPNSLFPESMMSDEERKVMQLFKSFKTPAQKKKFLELCEKAMTPEVEEFDNE